MNASTPNLNLHLACTVANNLLVAADAAEAAELFGNLLKQIIANDSYMLRLSLVEEIQLYFKVIISGTGKALCVDFFARLY